MHMKKKLIALLCAITCVLSLAGCGKEVEYTAEEQSRIEFCKAIAYENLSLTQMIATSVDEVTTMLNLYNKAEMKYLYSSYMYQLYQMYGEGFYTNEAELGAFNGMLSTYAQASVDMDGIVSFGQDASAIINGKEIIVTIPLYGNKCDGTFVFTYSNDIFGNLIEAEATAKTTIGMKLEAAGKNMGTAGLNTLLGMGIVFLMLILISGLIASFNLFNGSKKKKVSEAPVAAPAVTEKADENLADDTELVAVIMAAICAYEGNTSTDGFVVRSIRKANRRK